MIDRFQYPVVHPANRIYIVAQGIDLIKALQWVWNSRKRAQSSDNVAVCTDVNEFSRESHYE